MKTKKFKLLTTEAKHQVLKDYKTKKAKKLFKGVKLNGV